MQLSFDPSKLGPGPMLRRGLGTSPIPIYSPRIEDGCTAFELGMQERRRAMRPVYECYHRSGVQRAGDQLRANQVERIMDHG